MPARTHALLSTSTAVERLATPIDRVRPQRQWPASLAALEIRNYRLLLGSQALGATGGWMQRVAQDWMVLQLTGSVGAVGITVALQFLPFLMFGLFSGVIADRFPKKRILMFTQSAAALCAVTLGLLALTGVAQAWHVFVIAFLFGLVMVFDGPARTSLVSELVGPSRIRNAVSLNSSVFHSAALLGPALSGVLIGSVGLGWSFIANAVATAAVVGVISQIRPTVAQLPTPATRAKGQLREGLAYIRRTSEVRWALILLAVASMLCLNLTVVITAYADKVFDLGVNGYSLLTSLNAIGALTGALMSAGRRRTTRLRDLALLLGVLGILIAAGGLMPNGVLYGALLVVTGLVTLTFLIGANTLIQTTCAPAVRGRVMAVYMLIQLGLQAVGSPILGFGIDHVGPRVTLLVAGSIAAVLAVGLASAMARQAQLRLQMQPVRRTDVHLDSIRVAGRRLPFVTTATVSRLLPVGIVDLSRHRHPVRVG